MPVRAPPWLSAWLSAVASRQPSGRGVIADERTTILPLKLLIPVVSIVGLFGIHAEDSNHNVFQNLNLAVTKSGKINAIATSGTLKITDYGQPAFEVVFGEGLPFEAQPILPTLHQLSQLVAGVVETIEKGYAAP